MESLDFGKYNFYIWASYALTLIVLIWNIIPPLLEKKKLIKKIKRQSYLNNDDPNDMNEKIQ